MLPVEFSLDRRDLILCRRELHFAPIVFLRGLPRRRSFVSRRKFNHFGVALGATAALGDQDFDRRVEKLLDAVAAFQRFDHMGSEKIQRVGTLRMEAVGDGLAAHHEPQHGLTWGHEGFPGGSASKAVESNSWALRFSSRERRNRVKELAEERAEERD